MACLGIAQVTDATLDLPLRASGAPSVGPYKRVLAGSGLLDFDVLVGRVRTAHGTGRAVAVRCVMCEALVVQRAGSGPATSTSNRLSLPCSAGVRFLFALKGGVSTEGSDDSAANRWGAPSADADNAYVEALRERLTADGRESPCTGAASHTAGCSRVTSRKRRHCISPEYSPEAIARPTVRADGSIPVTVVVDASRPRPRVPDVDSMIQAPATTPDGYGKSDVRSAGCGRSR